MRSPDYSQLENKKIICLDMKSFYASVETSLRGWDPFEVPLAVVGDANRSGAVVLAATPALKEKYNIRTADRLYQIPENDEIIIVEAQMELYLNKSAAITEFLSNFVSPEDIQIYSVDESWINLTPYCHSIKKAVQLSYKIKKHIFKKFDLYTSIGMGPNMFLAKAAMDIEGKKSGFAFWDYKDVQAKLWPVEIKKCWGIGSKMEKKLKKIGVFTIGDLAKLPPDYLEKKFGIIGRQLYDHSWGVCRSELDSLSSNIEKSIGRGITLYRDYKKKEEIEIVIFELAEIISERAVENKFVGRTVSLSLSYSYKENTAGFSRQRTLEKPIFLTQDIFNTACMLLKENYRKGFSVRKIRLNMSNLTDVNKFNEDLFQKKEKHMVINRLKYQLNQRFNYQSLFYGLSLKKGSIYNRIHSTIGGHKK